MFQYVNYSFVQGRYTLSRKRSGTFSVANASQGHSKLYVEQGRHKYTRCQIHKFTLELKFGQLIIMLNRLDLNFTLTIGANVLLDWFTVNN